MIKNNHTWVSFKMKTNKILFSFAVFFSVFLNSNTGLFAQQDPQFSQYMFNQFAINPAYAGSKEAISSTLFLRSQWTKFDNGGEPRTETITIHSPLRKRKVALGLALIGDQIGPKNTFGILGSYAYRIRLGRGKLSMGLRMGAYQYTWKSINFQETETGIPGNTLPSFMVLTADAGVYYFTNTTYGGISLAHLNNGLLKYNIEGSNIKSTLVPHMFITGGKAWQFSEKLIFSPSFMIKLSGNSAASSDLNLSFLLQNRLWLGVSLRTGYGFVGYTQFHITDKFKIGYAYDFGTTKVSRQLGASHEVMISYDFSLSKPAYFSPRYF